jgi:hypothetical protein
MRELADRLIDLTFEMGDWKTLTLRKLMKAEGKKLDLSPPR